MTSDTKIISSVFDQVHSKLRYMTDLENHGVEEKWDEWSKAISNPNVKYIHDDCEGYALTFALLLAERGIPKSNIAICFCYLIENGENLGGHLTCKVFNRDQMNWYILDNNFPKPMLKYSVRKNFKWASCMYLDNPGFSNWKHDT